MSPILAVVLLAATAVLAGWRWRARLQLRRRLRREWGRPLERARPMALIADYHRVRMAARGPAASLDDRTCGDLHLDDVFARLDRTESVVGQQALYDRLRTAPVADHLDAFAALVDHVGADAPSRERVQVALAALRDPAAYHLCRLDAEGLQPRRWHVVFPVLAVAMTIAIASATVWPFALLIALCGVVLNFQVRLAAAGRTSAALALFGQIPLLLRAADVVAALPVPGAAPILDPLAPALARLRALRRYARWANRPAGNDLIDSLFEYLNLILLLDANAYYFGARELRRHHPSLQAVIGAVGDVDAAIAVASYRRGTPGWTRPRHGRPGLSLEMTAVRHPLIADAVPNDVRLAPPAGLLLTGANMSGKSTLLRTIGINVVLAQTIGTVLAASYDGPVFHVRSLLGRADDLIAGRSYYLVEAEAVVEMLAIAADGPPHLFLLDELLRGTNTVERIAAGAAVLTQLAGDATAPGRHLVVAATHDRELVELLDGRYAPAHLSDAIGPDGLVFDYHLRSGPATTRNAIALLALNGAPEAVVREAECLAGALDAARRIVPTP